ncbi:retinol dehydrogenase 11 [Xenopus laevis]|uniref:Retinol dehydrogenase 11 n=3 Tax=Xenopus laevis TaxID=8355 RepID=A0A974DQU8_XENLA|nr:retinol dehydrogenase 11 [Xenopus laevis]OCT96464.1 hypothetical protein XELAEV_18008671mg [Xenopus laevis]
MELLPLLNHPGWFCCCLGLALILRLQRRKSWDPRNCHVSLAGKTAIVTGANTGIGKCVAMDLARRKARVILACRSRGRGQKALEEIRSQTGNKEVLLELLDTSSMASVRAFAERILQQEKHLDILINNAGASGLPYSMTAEGLENTFATNHLGPFLLSNLLTGLMSKSAPSRIVFVSSFNHKKGEIHLGHLRGQNIQGVRPDYPYNCSKLMNIMCANEMARRLHGSGVTVTSVDPGIVVTEAIRNYGIFIRLIFNLIGFFFFRTPQQGAVSSLFCAVSEEAEGLTGKYIDCDCQLVLPSAGAQDRPVSRKLWEASEEAVGLATYSPK